MVQFLSMNNRQISNRIVLLRGVFLIFGALLVLSGPGRIWAYETIPKSEALARLDEIIVQARRQMNTDPDALVTLYDLGWDNIMDHPKVYAFTVEIIQKSTNPGSVLVALNHLSDDPIAKTKKDRRTKTIKILKGLIVHKSLWIRLAAADRLKDLGEANIANQTYLSLASFPEWEKQLDREIPMLMKGDNQDFYWYKVQYLTRLLERLLGMESRESRRFVMRELKNGQIYSILRNAAQNAKQDYSREVNLKLANKWRSIESTLISNGEMDHGIKK